VPFVNGTLRVHRIPPHARDDRETPLIGGGMAEDMPVIWVEIEADYFSREDWTGQISLIRHDKSGFRRTSNTAVSTACLLIPFEQYSRIIFAVNNIPRTISAAPCALIVVANPSHNHGRRTGVLANRT
jgi:hypothetical protein